MSGVLDINDNNFEQEVLHSQTPTVVDFWATWCGPCRKLSPIIEEISESFDEKVKFVKINVEESVETAQKYSISGIPCLLVFKNGEAVERMTGMMPKSTIMSNIEKHI